MPDRCAQPARSGPYSHTTWRRGTAPRGVPTEGGSRAFLGLLEGLSVQDIWERTLVEFRLDAERTSDAVRDAQAAVRDLL